MNGAMAYNRKIYKRQAEAAERAEIEATAKSYETHYFNHKQHTTTIAPCMYISSVEKIDNLS